MKQKVLETLQAHADQFVSGAVLAEKLGVSRTAVWKAVERLRQEGYAIDSLPRQGHRLSSQSDVLSEEGIRRFLTRQDIQIRVFPEISSTNTVLKQMAMEGAPAGVALVAGSQSAGRGRMGRSFYSPSNSGLYLSLLLRPEMRAADATSLTACAAVATAEALEDMGSGKIGIKWVNDLYLGGRKVCGILTEAALDCESGQMSYVVIGIGVNTRMPAENFPPDIRDIAGAVFGNAAAPDLRNRLAAGILDRLSAYAASPADPLLFEKYRIRSMVPGKAIHILAPGQAPREALALDLMPDYGLRVRLSGGEQEILHSGEISIRLDREAE